MIVLFELVNRLRAVRQLSGEGDVLVIDNGHIFFAAVGRKKESE